MFSSHVWDQVAPGCSSTHPPGDLHLPGQGWADLQVVVVPLVGRGWRGEEERAGRRLQSFPPYRPPGGSGGWKMLKIKNKATCSPCSTIFLFLASLPSKISLASNPDPAPTPSGGSSRPWKSDVDANCCSSVFFQVVWFPWEVVIVVLLASSYLVGCQVWLWCCTWSESQPGKRNYFGTLLGFCKICSYSSYSSKILSLSCYSEDFQRTHLQTTCVLLIPGAATFYWNLLLSSICLFLPIFCKVSDFWSDAD